MGRFWFPKTDFWCGVSPQDLDLSCFNSLHGSVALCPLTWGQSSKLCLAHCLREQISNQAVLTNDIFPTICCHSALCHPGQMYLFFMSSQQVHTYPERCTQQQMYFKVFLNLNNVSVVEAIKVCHQKRFVSISSPNEQCSFPEMPNCSKKGWMKLVHCSTSILSKNSFIAWNKLCCFVCSVS